jgi:hypothetical protein
MAGTSPAMTTDIVSRHCEHSEAIQKATKQGLDCFVAYAPRNDE